MKKISSILHKFVVILILFSISSQNIVFAQGFQQEDKTRIGYSDTTGKVSFIGADPAHPITVRSAQAAGLRPEGSALAMISQYASDFGLKNPSSELNLIATEQAEGRNVTRFQQVYNGVPVMGGELIVNATDKAQLLSLSGEMSPDLAVDTEPSISSKQALLAALELIAKHYQLSTDELEGSAPELWIYDSRLFEADGMQPSLVWRLEVKSRDTGLPINELVLVDAKRGNIALNFNQIDTAWNLDDGDNPPTPTLDVPTPTPTPSDLNNPDATETKTPDGTETSASENPHIYNSQNEVSPATGTGYYVNIATGNNSNSCTTIATPCKNIQETINKAASGDTIYVTSGTYLLSSNPTPNVVIANKNITLSGGWDSSFNSQIGASTIDGANTNNGILAISGTVIVENFIVQNAISGNSGAIYIVNGNFTLRNSTLRNNTAGNGAGIFVDNGVVTVINSTISANTAASGGGIYTAIQNAATVIIQNSTIAYNTAVTGGGIVSTNGTTTITNSIIANNSASGVSPDCNGTIYTANYNIVENNAGCVIVTGGNNLNIDPQIENNLTETALVHKLLNGSPAINGGDPNLANCPTKDQLGHSRPQGNACDMGAVEYGVKAIEATAGSNQTAPINTAFAQPLVVYVHNENFAPVSGVQVTFTAPATGASGIFSSTGTRTTTVATNANGVATTSTFTANATDGTYNLVASAAGYNSASFQLSNKLNMRYVSSTGTDAGATTCNSKNSPCLTINKAIQSAVADDIIFVATGTYFGTGTEVVSINKNITLTGGWDSTFTVQNGVSIIDGQSSRRGITIQYLYPTIVVTAAVIDHFTVQNGFHTSQGGGIQNNFGTIVLSNSIVNGNTSLWMGGGIYSSGTLTINNTTISGNSAGRDGIGGGGGGGIRIAQGIVTLNNSLVAGNILIGSHPGSGIDTSGTVILNNSTISGNRGGDGAGIYVSSPGGMILNNSTITKNLSYGFTSQGGTITIKNTIIAGNGAVADCSIDPSYGGSITSQGYNLIGRGCGFTAATGDIIGSSANPINPFLTPLQDNGGATRTHALMNGSPAINAGNPAIPGSGGNACLATDQRGTSRPAGARCDIGAYEGSVPLVTIMLINTYTANNSPNEFGLPGTFLCNETQVNCTNGVNIDADTAHKHAIGTYNFYISHHNRDSIDNQGMAIISSTDFGYNFQNAFWNGEQMVYGDGYSLADDVVGHELTHGVTQYESNLFYYYQSGAINESFSDVWGELFDQGNGLGTDTAGVKWLMGEDLPGGANRSMINPPAYGDPDKMTSTNYYTGGGDNGGVHYNSGINNKAAYLMVDGGTFNGKTVTAIGADKTLAVYYEVQTNLLTSGADYADLYNALYQGCLNLVGGSLGITAGNCQQVRNATDAVEMNLQPVANFNTNVPTVCSTGRVVTFSDDLESGSSNWSFGGSPQRWATTSSYGPFAHSGQKFLYADDYPASITDTYVQITNSITIPVDGYLLFHHAYDFEQSGASNYDGGVLEYSTNGGSSWVDAGSLIDFNGYKGTIYNNWNNPLKGRSAFVGASHGYISTRLNLAALAGQSVKFRWRMGLDDSGSMWGWWLDDIEIYECPSATINVKISGTTKGTYHMAPGTSMVAKYLVDGGPVEFSSNNGVGFVASLNQWRRNAASPAGWFTGVSQSMALPADLITNQYVMPLYNGTDPTLYDAILMANVDNVPRTITVTIGGKLMGTYPLAPSASVNAVYAVKDGPIVVSSDAGAKIIASLYELKRSTAGVSWNGQSEMMGLPSGQLSDKYVLPLYFGAANPSTLDARLYIGNVDAIDTTVEVKIAGVSRGTYLLKKNTAMIAKYLVDGGPVEISSNNGAKIVASLNQWRRNAASPAGWFTGVSQSMALPVGLITNQYVMPLYNGTDPTLYNAVLMANVDNVPRTITVTIGGKLMGTYPLAPSASVNAVYAVKDGPIIVSSDVGAKIIASLYELKRSTAGVSWNDQMEMMGLPWELLSDTYVLPLYFGAANPSTLDARLYIGVP